MANLNLNTLAAKDVQKIHHWAVVQATRDAMANTAPQLGPAEKLVADALGHKLSEAEADAVSWFYHETYSAIHGWVLNPPKK